MLGGFRERGKMLKLKLEKENGWSKIKIIAVTAFAMPGDAEKFKEVGLDLYISKPYTSNQLISFIEL